MNNSKKLFLVIALLLLGASLIVTNAQEDARKAANEKLDKLEGDVSSIVIKTNDGEVEFTAEEAQYLLKRMKADKMIITSHGGEFIEMDHDMHTEGENMIFIKKTGKGDAKWSHSMLEGDTDGTMKKINVEEEDGVKKVTVTTTKDGEETVETYEGEEADEFLETMHKENGMSFLDEDIINLDVDDLIKSGGDEDIYIIKKTKDKDGNIEVNVTIGEDGEHVFIHKDSDHDIEWITEDFEGKVKKEVNVDVKDGVKTVTVTTTEDGEEKVEVLTGDEADEYLEKMHDEDAMDGAKKRMKKITIEIEEDEDEHEEGEEEHEDD